MIFAPSSKMFNTLAKETMLSPRYIGVLPKKVIPSQKLNSSNVYYMPKFELGEIINSGREAHVYSVKGYDGIVARVSRDSYFAPHKLRPMSNQAVELYSSADKKISIQKRISGEPLHGKFWDISGKPSFDEFNKSMDVLEKLPDEAFEKYVDEVLKLRANGKDVDVINPNNYLVDVSNSKINIVDLEDNIYSKYDVTASDFYQFVDSKRLSSLLFESSLPEKEIIVKRVKAFFDRVDEIGKKKGINLSVEPIDYNKLQDNVVYLYHNDRSTFRRYGLTDMLNE